MIIGAGAYWTPVVTEDAGDYVPTAEALAAAQAALDALQAKFEAECRRCALCGQLTYRPDDFGLCSKTSEPHVTWRQRVLAREKGVTFRRPRKRTVQVTS